MQQKKHRPLKQEHTPQLESLSSKKAVQPDPFFYKKENKELPVLGQVNRLKNKALYLLHQSCLLIGSSQPEESLSNQSKALELANQYIDSSFIDIRDIQDRLYKIKNTLHTSKFVCQDLKSTGGVIDLGHSFKYLNKEKQLEVLLTKTIAATPTIAREELPSGGYEHVDPAKAWADYLFALCQLLPKRPYLITGTPTNFTEHEEEEGEDVIIRGPGGIRRMITNLLGRN